MIDFEQYALKFALVDSVDKIQDLRYACYTGLNAVKKIFEHRNKLNVPLSLPLQRTNQPNDFVDKFRDHQFDGEDINKLVTEHAKFLGDQKRLFDEITELSKENRYLDNSQRFTLPRFKTTKNVSITADQLFQLYQSLTTERPIKRRHIEEIANDKDIDEIITAFIGYNFI
jgi:hypothetical protein